MQNFDGDKEQGAVVMVVQAKASLEVLTWDKVRKDVHNVNPNFAKTVDALSPSNDYFFIKVKYPYGSQVLKNAVLMLPDKNGNLVPITDSSIDPHIRSAIDYNLNSNPVSMVLKNTFEIYLPLEDRTIPLNGLVKPGSTFGTFRILHPQGSHQPKFIWDMTAGARSIFMLPKITEAKKHMQLRKKFSLTVDKPSSLMAHWEIFRQLANHPDFPQPWDAEILYFSKSWFEHLDDKDWFAFYYQFHRSIWGRTEFLRNQPIWNLIFSIILKDYEARPSAYTTDTTKYLIYVGIGEQPGFAPARNNIAAPIEGLQKIYKEEYELRNYPPIIMQPDTFGMLNPKQHPIYYSLQFPTAIEFGKNSRERPSLISDLHEIKSLLKRYEMELLSNKFNTNGTPIHDLFNLVAFDYFHNNVELHAGMLNSAEMSKEDEGLLTTLDGTLHKEFPDMCSFVKGCIRVSKKAKAESA